MSVPHGVSSRSGSRKAGESLVSGAATRDLGLTWAADDCQLSSQLWAEGGASSSGSFLYFRKVGINRWVSPYRVRLAVVFRRLAPPPQRGGGVE